MSEKKRANLRDIEVKVLVELMKNSRKSDREISKVLGVSQPTVTRARTTLEKEGVIKEYTLIPDFKRLGYQIMAVLFMGKPETMDRKRSAELRKAVEEMENKIPVATLTVVDGIGLRKGRMIIILFKNYASYTEKLGLIRSLPNIEAENLDGFLVDLSDERNFRVFSMEQVARHINTFGTLRD